MSRPEAGRPTSLKVRLALWVLLPTLAISAIDLLLAYKSSGATAALVQQRLLLGSAKIISEQLSTIDGGYEINVPPAAFELFADRYQDRIYYSVRSKSGILIAGDGELPPFRAPLGIDQETYWLTTIRGEQVRVIAYKQALPSTNASDYAITQIAQTLHGYDAFRQGLLRTTIREDALLLAILACGLAIAFRWTLKPLVEFGEQLVKRKPGSLERLDADSVPSELRAIIHAMNDYVVRLDQTLGAYEQFVANTAHHLRTTFAILTSQLNFGRRAPRLDPAQQELLLAIQQSVAHGSKVINQLLVLAAVEQALPQERTETEVNVAAVLQEVIEQLAPLAQQRDIELGVDAIDPGIQILVSPVLLREVIANLIDNSIQHMQAPGSVSASLARGSGTALLRIVDDGPGIPVDQRQRVFERFYRIDESRPHSSGLGLAIVKEICDGLGATITLDTGEQGRGLCVQIAFPLVARLAAAATPSAAVG